MSESRIEQAEREIGDSLTFVKFCMRMLGVSLTPQTNGVAYLRQKIIFLLSVCTICYHVFSEIVYIGVTLSNSPRVEDFVPVFHTFGYGLLSIAKVSVLWYKKDVFSQLIDELTGIWPVSPLDDDAQAVKDDSLRALSLAHRWYFMINVAGVWFYNLTPIGIYLYELIQGQDASVGFIWFSWYPFDKHQPVAHVAVYFFEILAGQTCVWIMISTDLLFCAMASHICLLLQLLRKRLQNLGTADKDDHDYFAEIVDNITLHQRLIRYCYDVEDAYAFSNFVNYVLSSLNICCVVFVIVLIEPLMALSSKMFLVSALIQIGMICWYGDNILHENADIAVAAYNSGWYRTNPRCRRALLFLIRRAQKPIAFTAMKFTNISLVTYSSILTRSYSYFALLYTMYSDR